MPGRPRRRPDRREPDARAARGEEVAGASAAHRLIALAGATLVLGLAAAACSTPPSNSSPAQPANLENVEWILDTASLRNLVTTVPAGIHIDLKFEGDRVSGTSGCNTYSAMFRAIGGSIEFVTQFTVTAKACPQPVMRLEQAYLHALESSTTYQVNLPNSLVPVPQLILSGGVATLTYLQG